MLEDDDFQSDEEGKQSPMHKYSIIARLSQSPPSKQESFTFESEQYFDHRRRVQYSFNEFVPREFPREKEIRSS